MKKLAPILFFILINISFASKKSLESYTIKVKAESRNNYELSGNDLNGLVKGTDPKLTFLVGSKIDFLVDARFWSSFLFENKIFMAPQVFNNYFGKKDQIENFINIENNGDTTRLELFHGKC